MKDVDGILTGNIMATSQWHVSDLMSEEEKRLMEAGRAEDVFNLGVKYYHGKSVHKDFQRAAEFFSHVSTNSSAALFNLGVMHETGRGVAKNAERAAACFRIAAEQGACYSCCDINATLNTLNKYNEFSLL